jgi:hypothetical protein
MRSCVVSYLDTEGIRHTVEVEADTLYETAVLAMRTFRQHDCEPGSLSRLEVKILPLLPGLGMARINRPTCSGSSKLVIALEWWRNISACSALAVRGFFAKVPGEPLRRR